MARFFGPVAGVAERRATTVWRALEEMAVLVRLRVPTQELAAMMETDRPVVPPIWVGLAVAVVVQHTNPLGLALGQVGAGVAKPMDTELPLEVRGGLLVVVTAATALQ